MVFGPWLVGMGRALSTERCERIRQEERAEMAAHLHDSVLQTLTLMQKRAGDPREVAALARDGRGRADALAAREAGTVFQHQFGKIQLLREQDLAHALGVDAVTVCHPWT